MNSAPDLAPGNFTSMMRLDHNRAVSQLSARTGKPVTSIEKMVVWGNHSPTMYPDLRFASVGGQDAHTLVNDQAWYRDTYIPTVGKRGAAIIAARGASSAASAANAAIDHMHDWALGSDGEWVTMGVVSDGSYGIPEGMIYGFPCTCTAGKYQVIRDLEIDDFSRERMDFTLNELKEEREGVQSLLS
jgi:malate dehydrogenase